MNPIIYYILLHYIILEEMPLAGFTQPFVFFFYVNKITNTYIYIYSTIGFYMNVAYKRYVYSNGKDCKWLQMVNGKANDSAICRGFPDDVCSN